MCNIIFLSHLKYAIRNFQLLRMSYLRNKRLYCFVTKICKIQRYLIKNLIQILLAFSRNFLYVHQLMSCLIKLALNWCTSMTAVFHSWTRNFGSQCPNGIGSYLRACSYLWRRDAACNADRARTHREYRKNRVSP